MSPNRDGNSVCDLLDRLSSRVCFVCSLSKLANSWLVASSHNMASVTNVALPFLLLRGTRNANYCTTVAGIVHYLTFRFLVFSLVIRVLNDKNILSVLQNTFSESAIISGCNMQYSEYLAK